MTIKRGGLAGNKPDKFRFKIVSGGGLFSSVMKCDHGVIRSEKPSEYETVFGNSRRIRCETEMRVQTGILVYCSASGKGISIFEG